LLTGNLSPFLGVCVGAAVIGLVSQERVRSALGIALGAYGKFVTLILLPLLVLARKWHLLVLSLVVTGLIGLATLAVAGPRPFVVFAQEIVPTLGMPADGVSSVTAHSFLLRLFQPAPVPPSARVFVRTLELGLILVGAAGLIRARRTIADDPARLLAAALAMLAGFLIFSPLAWDHHILYLVPLWGYLVWEARRSPGLRVLIALALLLLWAPHRTFRLFDHVTGIRLPWIVDFTELAALLLVVMISLARLHGATVPAPTPASSRLPGWSWLLRGLTRHGPDTGLTK
jgi:hypothetical protein